jgi:conjugative transposon TraM protein
MKNNNSRKAKALLVMPLFIIPLIILAFWAAGGGRNETQSQRDISGLNMQLPNAYLKDDAKENKLSFYEESEKDSARLREMIKTDPFYRIEVAKDTAIMSFNNGKNYFQPGDYTDPNEEKVYRKLAELNQQLNSNAKKSPVKDKVNEPLHREDVDRLEDLMQDMRGNKENDPELEQLNGMMEKILDIQHPERVKNLPVKHAVDFQKLFTVNKDPLNASISLLSKNVEVVSTIGFYSLDNDEIFEKQNAIEAVVHENQTLVSGAVIKLRLLNDIEVDRVIIPRDNFVYGTCTLSGERLYIEINSIRSGSSLYTVKMEVYDMDGLPGIYIPGAITRDAIKNSTDNSLQMVNMTSVDTSIAAQATSAVVNAAKSLLSKKINLVSVNVKSGYRILIKNKNQ